MRGAFLGNERLEAVAAAGISKGSARSQKIL